MKNALHTKNLTRRKRQAGFTVVELLVVFAIFGVLIAAASYGLPLMFTSKGQSDTKFMDYAMECARTTYGNENSYSGATISVLANSNCFPSSLVTNKGASTATVSNKYGGSITVAAVNLIGTNDGLKFTDPGVPSDVCVERLKQSNRAVVVSVTPAGGSKVDVMTLGQQKPNMALYNACGTSTTATMEFSITKN